MLIPINYHGRTYPQHIKPKIDEVAGHFDVSSISVQRKFSLHTEYSYGARKLNTDLIKDFILIDTAAPDTDHIHMRIPGQR